MKNKTKQLNYIFLILVVAFIGLILFNLDLLTERKRQAESDFSEGWLFNGDIVDADSVVTKGTGSINTITKCLPNDIKISNAICFISVNCFFDLYIGDKLVYSFSLPENITGNGYGTTYHTVNLSPDYAGKTAKFVIKSTFKSGNSGKIGMISIESPRKYLARMSCGQLLAFILSAGIAIMGILLLIIRLIIGKSVQGISIVALAVTAIISGLWMAADTGFLTLVADAAIFSRTVSYLCMYLCFVPLAAFIYSITREKKKTYLIVVYAVAAVYYIFVIFSRAVLKIDIASAMMVRTIFVFELFLIIMMLIMLLSDKKYCKKNGLERKMGFFYFGTGTLAVCVAVDTIIYLSGFRSVSGYATFSRPGAYIFFISMAVEIARAWAHEYASLKTYGYTDELTGVGNRRAYDEYENKHKDEYPYGYVICDINSLKMTNDEYGHERGDELIKNVSGKLVEVFGNKNVFRIGGDEFVAYSYGITAEGFKALTDRAKELLSGSDISASVGGVYAPDRTADPKTVKKKAEEIMYAEKQQYYIKYDRRRR